MNGGMNGAASGFIRLDGRNNWPAPGRADGVAPDPTGRLHLRANDEEPR